MVEAIKIKKGNISAFDLRIPYKDGMQSMVLLKVLIVSSNSGHCIVILQLGKCSDFSVKRNRLRSNLSIANNFIGGII